MYSQQVLKKKKKERKLLKRLPGSRAVTLSHQTLDFSQVHLLMESHSQGLPPRPLPHSLLYLFLPPKKLDIDYVCAFPFLFKINKVLQVQGTPWDP